MDDNGGCLGKRHVVRERHITEIWDGREVAFQNVREGKGRGILSRDIAVSIRMASTPLVQDLFE